MPPRYSLEPLAEALGCTLAQLGRRLGVSGSTWKQYRDVGVSELVADRLAVKVGKVVYEVWPEVLDAAIAEVDYIDDIVRHKIMVVRAKTRLLQAQWARQNRQSNPAAAQANRERRMAYYAAHGEYERARQRRYRQANREAILVKQRAYDRARRARLRAERQQPDDAMVA